MDGRILAIRIGLIRVTSTPIAFAWLEGTSQLSPDAYDVAASVSLPLDQS